MQSFNIWYQISMNVHQRNISTNQANSSLKDNCRFSSKWTLFLFYFWLQWLQSQWKNVRPDIFLLKSTTVCITYCLTFNVIRNVISTFTDHGDSNFKFSRKQFQLLGNVVKILVFQSFVLGFAHLLMLLQDRKKGSTFVPNMIPLLRNAFNLQGLTPKVTPYFVFVTSIPLLCFEKRLFRFHRFVFVHLSHWNKT